MSDFSAANSPFDLANTDAYDRWRERKLAVQPAAAGELIVEVRDPRRLSDAEFEALRGCLRRCNMVLYAGATGEDPDKAIPRLLGERFGLLRLNHNWLADDDGLTSLTVSDRGERPTYIPYTDRPIKWHTDGYYNSPQTQIHGLMLHCVHPAAEGGGNALMDHEMAYLLLRDLDPAHIKALMQADAMTIPPGTDMHGNPRPAASGPVFSVLTDGNLHMRYTARRRNIEWKASAEVAAAVAALEHILESAGPYIYRARLESGMGLISNNVLHDRAGFHDVEGAPRRLIYRARYYDRVASTGIACF